MIKPRQAALAAAVLALLAGPALGAVHYQATTTTDGPQGESVKMVVEGWIDGEKARIEFRESGHPLAASGSYLVTLDGGRNVFLVNPEERTFTRWDVEAMLKLAGSVLQGMGSLVKIEFGEPQVERLLDEDGGQVAGLATRHLRFRTAYSTQVKVLGMKQASQTESTQDLWVTGELTDLGLGVWLRAEPPRTGNENLDRLIASGLGTIQGFPLKAVTVSKSTGGRKGQRETVVRSETVVTELDIRAPAVDPARYQIPQGYTEVQMLPEGQGPDGGPFGGLRQREGGR
jgi:hypothetical protein